MVEHGKGFSEIAFLGPAMFYSSAFSEEELSAHFEAFNPETARDFVVLRTLAEVQKCGAALRRWQAEEDAHLAGDGFDAVVRESLEIEQVGWQRRLIEALTVLINFSMTNKPEYYAHFLAVQKYEQELHRAKDELEFFGVDSELTRRKLSTLRQEADGAYARISDRSICWYLRRNERYKFSSFRDLYKHAMKAARPSERTALGYTYYCSFGTASERLHFKVVDPIAKSKDRDTIADSICGLLAAAIICRAHDLCSVEPQGININLMDTANRDRPLSPLLSKRARLGDFVLSAGPHLGEVLEVRSTEFGYESYRIRFLDTEKGPGVDEDWLPAPCISLFMNSEELIQGVRACLDEKAPGDFRPSDEECRDASRVAAVQMWNQGVRAYFSQLSASMPQHKD